MCGRSALQPSSWQMETRRWLSCIRLKPSSKSPGESTRERSCHVGGGCRTTANWIERYRWWKEKIPDVLDYLKLKRTVYIWFNVFFLALSYLKGSICRRITVWNVPVFGLKINAAIQSVKIFAAGDGVCLMIIWELSGYTRLTFCYQHNRAIISQLGRDMPFWLQFALVISSIHIEMRLSPPPRHNVISSLPSQKSNMDALCGRNYGANAAFHQHQIQPEFQIITRARAARENEWPLIQS